MMLNFKKLQAQDLAEKRCDPENTWKILIQIRFSFEISLGWSTRVDDM